MKYVSMMLCGILFGHVSVYAQVVITEVMYDAPGSDSKTEWLVVENKNSEPVDLTGWRFVEGGVRHTLMRDAGLVMPGLSKGVIADYPDVFLETFGDVGIPVFDSSFSLNNSGETLELLDSEGVSVDAVTYTKDMGANGDGNTLHREGGSFVAGPVSFGGEVAEEKDTSEGKKKSSKPGETISAHSGAVPVSKVVYTTPFEIMVPRDRLVAKESFVDFEIRTTEGQDISWATWAFGDATTDKGVAVRHGYAYEGVYTVVVEAGKNSERAVARFEVTVFDPEVYFGAVTNEYVELYNMSPYEVNLGGWELRTGHVRFVFPKDTIIGSDQLIKFSTSVIGSEFGTHKGIELYTPMGNEHAQYDIVEQ